MSLYSSVSPGWVDNMRLDTLTAALRLNSKTTNTMQALDPEKFWSTPPRHYDTESHEVMEVTLSNVRLVNHIKFEVVKFPHDVYLECFDLSVNDWVPLYDAQAPNDEPCGQSVLDCVPAVLPNASNVPDDRHPQHSYPNHWHACEWVTRPVRFQRIRVVLKRHGRAKCPRNALGSLVAFSLAVKNLYCGYKIYSRECIPRPEPVLTSVTEHQEFAQSTDILGSAVSYSIRINRAENILRNDPSKLDNASQTLTWRSEPQPYPWNVVNYFMDVRDANGDPQVLDRFYIDPLNEGPNVNLYYSNDEPEDDFVAADTPLPPQVAVINGQTDGKVLSSTTQTYGRTVYIDVDNTPVCFVPGRKWWFGARMNWRFMHSVDLLDHPIFDCGQFHLAMTRYGLRFATAYGDYFYVDCDEFQPAHNFTFMAWYDGKQAFLRIHLNGQHYRGRRELTVPLTMQTVSKLRIAGFFGVNASLSADFRLQHMVLKADETVTEELCEDFLTNPEPYVKKPEFDPDPDQRTVNSLLRYHPDFCTSDFPAGLRGGGPTRYTNLEWAPIARDYILRKGFLQFPPTKAKYWKFEFCDLVPEPYEVYVPIKKTVKTYRTEMWSIPQYIPSFSLSVSFSLNLSVRLPGVSVSVGIASQFSYRDTRLSMGSGVSVSVSGKSSTMVRVATNHTAISVLSQVNWAWNFLPGHKLIYIPRFEKKVVHEYDYIDVEHTTKMAYFVGLKYVQPYRVDYLSVDDTAQYTELFQDVSHLDSDSGFVLSEDHALSSGDTRFAQAQSRVMPSNRIVRGLQFATTQSAPIQLLPDDDFDDPDHKNWNSVGDGALAPFTTDTVAVGSTLRVDRSSREPSWGELSSLFPTWGAFAVGASTFSDVEDAGNPAQAFGGIESNPVSTPPGGRIHVAARVVAPEKLQSPLYVQIIDAENNRVLAEQAAEVQANQITEWHASYTIGEGGDVLAWRWRDFSTNISYLSYVDQFNRVNAANLGTMSSGQPWQSGPTGHAISGLTAVTATAGAYDFITSGTPWGTLEVVVGTMAGTGQTYAQLLDFGPLQLDDQGVLSFKGGKSALPTSSILNRVVQANDDIRLDILPTALVPSDKRHSGWVDNVTLPYSIVVYLNGTWIKTIAHRLGSRVTRGILGRLNQQFKSFAWLPASYGQLPGPVMRYLPVPGQGSFDANRLTWVDADNVTWSVVGSWDNTTTAATLVATSNGARFVMDTRYWYGHLSAQVRHVADGSGGSKHGNVLCLDDDLGVYLDAAGNVVKDGVSYGNLISGGVANNTFVQVSFLDTKSVAASVRGSISPATSPRMLAAWVNGNLAGVLGGPLVQTMNGTRRGLAGDAYNSGLDANGNPNPLPGGTNIADLHTSFESFAWAPDASNVVIDPKTPKWDEISQKATGTYDSLAHYLTLNTGQLKARVIQRSSSIDIWDMDTLSMYAEPIVWSFSNDGGNTFYNAFDIRNNPNGVMIFPEGVTVTQVSGQASQTVAMPGQALVWRVVSYAPHSKISSLTIRPWYGGLLSGITHRVGVAAGGPNVMPYDHYPAIEQDARFQTWHDPIPEDWYYRYRLLARSKDEVVPPPKVLLVPEALTSRYKDEV